MFGNNYSNPYNYNGYTQPYGYSPYPQSVSPTQNTLPQTISTNTNKVFVKGVEDVRNYRLPPNSDYTFLDNDKPLLYQKTVDGKGQFEVKVFDITPHKESEVSSNAPNLNDYVLRSDFDKLSAELIQLKNKIQELGGAKYESVKQQSNESNATVSE